MTQEYKEMSQLRQRVHREMRINLNHRIAQNPFPSHEELVLGVFLEEIEPQVREAVLSFNRKGYKTIMSGFFSNGRIRQQINGPFVLDEATITELHASGVIVLCSTQERNHTFVEFYPERADLDEIRDRWDQIVRILPDTGQAVSLSPPPPEILDSKEFAMDGFRRDFRHRYGIVLPQTV